MTYPETDVLNRLVASVFRIEDVTLGEPARGLIAGIAANCSEMNPKRPTIN